MMRERPPVRAILEHMAQDVSIALDRENGRPLVDGRAGIVRLHELRPALRAAVELHHFGNAIDAVADEAREDPPLALGPLAEVAFPGVEEALRIATAVAVARGLAEH